MPAYIKKVSGLKEPFDKQKIIRSLQHIGASKEIIDEILDEIDRKFPEIKSTKQIFNVARDMLQKRNVALASRYNLKKALLAFGPAGFPFEQFIAALLREMGYTTNTNQYIQGFCVEHEIDIIAIKDTQHFMVETKFHNRQKYKSDVKVTLYVKGRFDDIIKAWEKKKEDTHKLHTAWLVTNTSFTTEAIKYAQCVSMNLMSWKYPEKINLRELITKYKLHPITSLVTLTGRQKKVFLKNGWVLCRDAAKHKQLLKSMGYNQKQIEQLVQDAQATCRLPH